MTATTGPAQPVADIASTAAMRVAVGAIVKNEAPYLLEWIAYHRTIGFSKFFIADNDSDDGTTELLAALDAQGVVTHIPFPTGDEAPQLRAYRRILNRYGGEFDWIAIIDADEFIMLDRRQPIDAFIRSIADETTGAILLNWAIYGSSGHRTRTDGLVMQRFTHRAERNYLPNHHYKMIIRSGAGVKFKNPHHVNLRPGYAAAMPDGKPLVVGLGAGLSDRVVRAGIRINHYTVKSFEECRKKLARGRADHLGAHYEQPYFENHDRNEIFDPVRPDVLAATQLEMQRLALRLPPAAVGRAMRVAPAVADATVLRQGGADIVPAFCLHLFYEDIAAELIDDLGRLEIDYDLFVTGPVPLSPDILRRLDRLGRRVVVMETENRGRDIRPFLALLRSGRLADHEIVCKLHTKTNADPWGNVWRRTLVENAIGTAELAERIVTEFAADPSLMMVGARRLYLSGAHRSKLTFDGVRTVLRDHLRIGMPEQWGFFGGTMFWARRQLFDPLLNIEEGGFAFAAETGAVDGALEHVLERVFGLLPTLVGGRIGLVEGNVKEGFAVDTIDAPGVPSELTVKKTLRQLAKRAAMLRAPAEAADA